MVVIMLREYIRFGCENRMSALKKKSSMRLILSGVVIKSVFMMVNETMKLVGNSMTMWKPELMTVRAVMMMQQAASIRKLLNALKNLSNDA